MSKCIHGFEQSREDCRYCAQTAKANDATLARIAALERENAELHAEIENLLHTIARYQADAGSSARMKIADNDKTGAAQFRAVELALDLVHKDCSLQVSAIASEKENERG